MKRVLSMLCVVVLLFTMHTLKRDANTLERIPMCGFAEHTHTTDCYEGDALVCGRSEHVHTDACYQEGPSYDEVELEIGVPVVDLENTDLDVDLSLSENDFSLVTEDVAPVQAANAAGEGPKSFALGEETTVSRIIRALGLNLGLGDIAEVGIVDDGKTEMDLIGIEKVGDDYRIWSRKDFAQLQLALILDNEIVTVRLLNGVAAPTVDAAPVEEVSLAEDIAPAEDVTPTEDTAPAEDAPQAEEDELEIGEVPVEDDAIVEEAASIVPEQTEVEIGDLEDAGLIIDDMVDEAAIPSGEIQLEEEQTEVDEEIADQGDETEEEAAEPMDEAQPEAEPAGVSGEIADQGDETEEEAAEPMDEAQPEEEPAEVDEGIADQGDETEEEAAEPMDEAQPEEEPEEAVEEIADPSGETEEEAAEPMDEAQPEAEPAGVVEEIADQDDETEEEAAEPMDEAQPEEEPAEVSEETADPSDETEEEAAAPIDEAQSEAESEESGEETADPSDETEEEAAEPIDEAQSEAESEESGEETAGPSDETEEEAAEPADEAQSEATPEEAPAEAEEEEADEAVGEDGLEDIGEQEPADEDTMGDEQEPADEDAGEGEEAEGEAPADQPDYVATIDLSEVVDYPLSLNALLSQAAPVADVEAVSEAEAAEADVDEAPAWTIDYDQSLLTIEEAEGDYRVTPAQSFESTQITVDNGNRYALTLINCALPEAEEAEAAAEAAQPEDERPVYAETIDLSEVVDYPLSLNALLSQAAPETAPAEAEGEEPGEAPAWIIDYDQSLLIIEEAEGDHLITPVAGFESALVTVDNGSRYELTFVNYALPAAEEAAGQPEIAYPAQDFEGHTRHMKVVVSAPEGAFPEGTTMAVEDVEDEKTLTDIEDTVSEEFVEVKRVHAVDITFTDAEGNEIEPLVPISVVMSVEELEQRQEAVVVHVDDAGATEVVESRSEAPAGETEVKVEMPATDAPAADDAGEASVGFEADAFSVYAVVITETIETKYIDAAGETWNISVGYGPEAGIPAGATLAVEEVEGDYLEQTVELLKGRETITLARFFDITILDAEGNAVQPAQPVEVKATLAEQSEDAVKAVHFAEEGPELIEASQDEDAVSFDAASFSVYGIVYTVDFHFGVDGEPYEFTLPGGGAVGMRELAPALGLVEDTEDAVDLFARSVESVTFSDESLVKVVPVEMNMTVGALKQKYELESEYSAELTEEQIAELNDKVLQAPDWALVSLKPFDTEETLTVALATGETFTVAVTDAQLTRTVIAASGEAYEINVTYGEDAAIPEGAELKVREILPEDEAYASYLEEARRAASGEASAEANGEGDYARFFDIEIWAEDQKVEPAAPVTVDIALADAPQTGEALKVVHFDEADGPVVMQTEAVEEGEDEAAETAKVRFETDGFSVYAVLTYGNASNVAAKDLGGRSCTIHRGNDYVTSTLYSDNGIQRLNKGNAASAATWQFEETSVEGQYYVSTMVGNQKKYLSFTNGFANNGYRANANLSDQPMIIKVEEVKNNNNNSIIGYRMYVNLPEYDNGNTGVYLNELAGANGFAGWGGKEATYNYDVMTFDFKDPTTEVGDSDRNYVLVAKRVGSDECYSIQSDGSLQKVLYDVTTNTVTVDTPKLWNYRTVTENGNTYTVLRHEEDGYNFNNQQLATASIYTYIDPTSDKGTSSDKITSWKEVTIDGKTFKDADTIEWVDKNNVNLNLDDQHHIYNNKDGLKFLAIHENQDGILELVGNYSPSGEQLADINAWDFYLAKVNTLPAGHDWKTNTVSHIDIGVVGEAFATIPLPYGKYKDAAGNDVIVNTNKRVHLSTNDVDVTADDIKRAEVTAFKKNGDVVVPVNEMFFITGYSSNKETTKSNDQVRIAGVFTVAQGPSLDALMTNGSIDVNKYNYNTWGTYNGEQQGYRDAVLKARLENKIYYNVTVTKPVKFPLVDENNKPLYEEDGTTRATVNLDVTFSASFDYWDSHNECPPMHESRYYKPNYGDPEWDDTFWLSGGIWRANGSGMDFILGGSTQEARGTFALQVTKTIEDENGTIISLHPGMRIENAYDLLKNADASPNTVIGLNVGGYERDADYTDYDKIDEKSTIIGQNGIGMIYAYDLTTGMYAIREHTDEGSLPRTIVDADGEIWSYKETYIETEYEKRGDKYDAYNDPMHFTKVYTLEGNEAYNSIPEVLGSYHKLTDPEGQNSGQSDYLEYFVHNIYVPTKTSLTVEKTWENGEAPAGASVDVLLKRYRLVKDGGITPPEPTYATLVISDDYRGLAGDRDYSATYTVTGPNGYNQTFHWKNGDIVIDNLALGEYTVVKQAGDQDGYSMANGSNSITTMLRATGKRIHFDATDYTPNQENMYHNVIVKSYDTTNTEAGGYVWLDTFFQSGSTLTFSVGAPSWHPDDRNYTFSINDGPQETINKGTTTAKEFVLDRDTTIIIYGETPYYTDWLNPEPSVVMNHAAQNIASNSRMRMGRKALMGNAVSTPLVIPNEGSLPAVSGYTWQPDTTWCEGEGLTVHLPDGGHWQKVVDDLEKQDTFGNVYAYYIESVTETGMPSGMEARVDVDGSGKIKLVYGDHEKENSDRPNSQLSLTNTLPTTTDIKILKVDSVTNDSLSAVFSLYKYSDAEFQNQDGSAQSVTVNGNATISGLGVGYYRLVETQWPSGYVQTSANLRFRVYIDGSAKEVMVQYIGDDNNTVSYDPASKTFTVRNTPKGALKITKVVQVNDAVPTSDAHKALTNGTYTFSVTNAAGIPIEGSPFSITYSNGAVTEPAASYVLVADLDPGVYTITETGSTNALMTFKSVTGGNEDANGTSITVTVVAGDNTASNASAKVEYTNNREVVDIDATKTWKNEKSEEINETIKKATVTFELRKKVGNDWSKVEIDGIDNPQTMTVGDTANANAWKAQWHNLPKYDEGGALIQYRVVETNAEILNVNVKPDTDPVADVTIAADAYSAEVNLDNTLPTTSISVTKLWKDGTANNADRVFAATKKVSFELYQKLGNGAGNSFKENNLTVVGEVTYHPASGENRAYWDEWTRDNLPRFVYDETNKTWNTAAYYVQEIGQSGVTITYKKGNETASSDAASAAVADGDTSRLITITNTDQLVNLKIIKVDANGMTKKLAGAGFELLPVSESDPSVPAGDKIDPETSRTDKLTGENGEANFNNLAAGYYKVTETHVPAGYILTSSKEFYIHVDGGTISLVKWVVDDGVGSWQDRIPVDGDKLSFETTASGATATVGNDAGASLPATGGRGTTLYHVFGSLLMLAAAVLLVVKRRMRA